MAMESEMHVGTALRLQGSDWARRRQLRGQNRNLTKKPLALDPNSESSIQPAELRMAHEGPHGVWSLHGFVSA